MKTFYEKKAAFHFKEYQLSVDGDKPKAAEHHMREYLNYKELFELYDKVETIKKG
jgi:hypothetical protein